MSFVPVASPTRRPSHGTGNLAGAPFPDAARIALKNPQLRRNIGNATSTIRTKRASAVAELDDWAELRDAAASIKDDALGRLDGYLEQLEERVTAAGGVVHWARDSNEANQIITSLVVQTGATDVVKVKSMATQEIGLNEALAEAGICAWESEPYASTSNAASLLSVDGSRNTRSSPSWRLARATISLSGSTSMGVYPGW